MGIYSVEEFPSRQSKATSHSGPKLASANCGVAQHLSPGVCVYSRRSRHSHKTEGDGTTHLTSPTLSQRALLLSHRLTCQIHSVGTMHETIQNGVCQRRIAYDFMPMLHLELTGYQGGALAVAILEELQ